MKTTPTANLTLSIFMLLGLSLPVCAANTSEDRWFEIEVILLSQLADKQLLKESFPPSVALPKYRKIIDLLGPYLQPNIASLKQLLPHCDDPVYPAHLIEQNSQLPALFQQKTLTEIAASEPTANEAAFSLAENNEGMIDKNNLDVSANISAKLPQEQTIFTPQAQQHQALEQAVPAPLTEHQLRLVAQAELAFSPLQFTYNVNAQPKKLCAIKEDFFKQQPQLNENFSYNGFPVAEVTGTINGIEDLTTKQAYLISKDSLQLHDIVKQLRRSKNFKPVLHLGWRQIVKTKKSAIPVKLYAGENLLNEYQQALSLYQEQVDHFNKQDQAEQTSINLTENNLAPIEQRTSYEQAIQARIAQILQQAEQIPADASQIIAELDSKDLTIKTNEMLMIEKMPPQPVQPWYINGFLKVEVDHYLHITADFTVMNMTSKEQATWRLQPNSALNPSKAIQFEQNKRVISGEIHYFDHPYMGMIVQIRRHEQLEQLDE